MHSLITIVFLLLLPALTCQATKTDSLTALLNRADGENRITILQQLSREYRATDPQKSTEFARLELTESIKTGNRTLQAEAMNDLAVPLILMQRNNEAIKLLEESTRILDSLNNKSRYAMAMNSLGVAYSQYQSNEKALKCYLTVLPYYLETKDSLNAGKVLMNIGLLHERLKDPEEAIKASMQSLEIFTRLGNQKMVASVWVNMGLSLTTLGRFEEATQYLEKALEYYETQKHTFGMAVTMTNLGKLYKAKKKYDEAIMWFAKSLPLIRSIHNQWAEASVNVDLASIYSDQGKWNAAIQNLNQASALNGSSPDASLQAQIYNALYKVYDTLGNARLALDFFKKYSSLNDTLINLQKSRMIEELQLEYDINQKVSENNLLRKDIQAARVRQWILAAIILFVALVSVLIIIILYLKRRNLMLINDNAVQEKLVKEFELEKIQALNQLKAEENEKLQIEIQFKEQALVFQTMQRMELSNLNQSVYDKLQPFHLKISNQKDRRDFLQLLKSISTEAQSEPLADFQIMFNQLHKSFSEKLTNRCPNLSTIEMLVCSMLRINLSTKDIARLLNLTPASVDMIRHRIRQKLEVDPKQSLSSFMITL